MADLKYKNILWLEPPRFSGGLKRLMQAYIRRAGLNPLTFKSQCLTVKCLKKIGKNKFTWDESRRKYFDLKLQQIQPDFIIVNDKAALGYITSKYISLASLRGSILRYKDIPCIVLDDIFKTKSTSTGGWVLLQDLGKLKRWLYGWQREEPSFSHTVVRSLQDLEHFEKSSNRALVSSCDIETSGRGKAAFISCIGYTILERSGNIHSWVIPFFTGARNTGAFWPTDESESRVWEVIRIFNASSIPKIFQNGTYDVTFLTRFGCPVRNYILDTMNMMHSLWPEAKKNLAFISSLALDYYLYWKDEGKEESDASEAYAVPQTENGMENYWRYNALDCHYTLLSALFYLKLITNPKLSYALVNYEDEIAQVTGPAFAMSMRGVRVNKMIKDQFMLQNLRTAEKELKTLRTMIADEDEEFNPNSPVQCKTLIYDILNSKELPRKGRSTDEKILKLIQTQGPLQDIIIDQIWKTKKPANNASKYGENLWLWGNRLLYKMNGTGTETWRYSSKSHDLWIGTQVQNIPYSIRPMIEPDPGWILFDIDYAQSDAYFTAFTLGEENFIKTMLSPNDTHCIHAAFFFKLDYDKLIAAHKKKEDWCSHNVTGVRSITKRVVYGANYLMMGYTLFITMGKEAVIAAAEHLGYENPQSWSYRELIALCEKLLDSYFEMYPNLLPQLNLEIQKAANNGNKFTCAFGKTRSFFGNITNDDSAKREFASFIGQGGTAGNVNKAIRNIYYRDIEPKNRGDVMLLFQVHDSLVGQIRENRLDLIPQIEQAMMNECTIHGRSFVVPVEAQVGLGWGKRLMDYQPNLTLEEIKSHDETWMKKNGFQC